MRLFHWKSSPQGCKVLALAQALGIKDKIEIIALHPWEKNAQLHKYNPLNKIPTLITDDDQIIYDSPVICEYLTSSVKDNKMIPAGGHQRWEILKYQALADGIMESATLCVFEQTVRPKHLQSDQWVQWQSQKVSTSLDTLENVVDSFFKDQELNLAHIATVIALHYLSLRFKRESWHGTRPKLTKWYDQTKEIAAIADNMPNDAEWLPEQMNLIIE